MIEPALAGEAFLGDVARAAWQPEGLHLWWLGQSGFLVDYGGARLVLDPYLSDSLTGKYAGSERPHVRMTRRVVEPGQLTGIDVVTASHGHTDHLDAETLQPLLAANPGAVLVAPRAIGDLAAERAGVEPLLVGDGDAVEVGPFRLVALPAAHEELERDAQGDPRFLSFVVEAGPFHLFHAGDTVDYPGLAERLRPFELDLALLPINGRDPARGVAGNLDGAHAARLAQTAGARVAVPMHYEMFEFNTASPDGFERVAARLGQPVRVLRAGERLSLLPEV